ncbi:alpha-2-macroglobulin family protein [bacterium]|nr:alpha-2-macroglobulin family protein [bacterium]
MHLRAIVRGPGMKAPEPFPVQIRIERPDGRRFKTFTTTLSRWGTAEVDVPLPEWARLGRYRAEVHLPQGKERLGTEVFRVEEFMPDRMKVEATADERRYGPGDTLQVTVKARHLFGAPAAGRKVSVRCVLQSADFELDDAKNFRFADSGKEFEPITEDLGHAMLDGDGKATFAFHVPTKLAPPSGLFARFVATVHEVGGRAVSTSLVRDVDAYPHYIGIARERDGAVEPRKSERFLVKAVRPDGSPAPVAQPLEATLYRVVWNTILRRDRNGRYRYLSEREERPAGEATVAVQNGAGTVAFTPPAAGLYRLRVAEQATGVSADLTFHCSGTGYVPWAREKPERLELVPDKKSYAPGETARVLIKAPFAGQALVTIEGDRVHLARTVTLEKNTGEFTFTMQAAYGPNVYCTAAVVRRVRPGAKWAPHRAFGSVPIVLDSAPQRLTVEVGSPKETRPGGPLRVAVKVRDAAGNGTPAEITLAAVDEGICQLIRFETPDPWSFFYGKRGLDVRSADVYALLMPEVAKRKVGGQAAPGGGGPGEDERRRLNPIRAERVKTIALWQGAVETGPDGTAEVVLDVPHFNGQLRLMAVATGTSHFGSAEQPVVVKQPLLIRTTFPRFLSPGDDFSVPVAVFNNTKQSGDVKLTITGSDGVEFSPNGKQSVRVAAGKEGTVVFNVHASAVPGVMKLQVSAVLGDETATEDVEIAVRPPATLRFASGSGAVPAGQTAHFDVPGGWVEGTAKYSLTFTSLPGIKLGNSLRYVLHYPYGCVEQTTSSAMPLLYLGDVAALAEPDVFGGDSIEPYVQAGIDRVLSMQVHTGGFGYWPGDYTTYPWGSAYATHFLVEARKAGYAVYKDNLDAALAYLDTYLKEEEDDKHTLPVKAYACMVLALGGRPNRSWAQRLFEDRSALPPYSRCHLAAALALTKQPGLAKTLIGSVPVPDGTGPADTGGLLHSSTRETAILLSVFADVAPDHPNIPELLRRLEKAMDNGRWRSTQENAFALMALGKYLRHKNEKDVDFLAEASVDGKHLTRFTQNDRVRLAPENLGGRTVNVKVTGKGTLYYYWTAEGVPTSGKMPEFDNGLTIRRTLRSRDGRELNAAAIPHGEVVVIDLAVRANHTVENVAISDLLPAGFEIENPRLATAETVRTDGDGKDKKPMRKNLLSPDRVEMRDDRLLLFTTVGSSKTYHYRYVVRAVTQGTFALPPVSASCMYDPGIASAHGAGHIQVVGQ